MTRTLRFTMMTVLGLGVLAWGGWLTVNHTLHEWFERDIQSRSQLVLTGTRRALIASLRSEQRRELPALLDELTQDERMLAAAVCGTRGEELGKSEEFPRRLPCSELSQLAASATWGEVRELRGGPAYVSVLPLMEGENRYGNLALVHDYGHVARREATTRRYLLVAFCVLAAAASLLTVISSRMSWRSWSDQLMRLLPDGLAKRPEAFRPVPEDMRAVVEQLLAERESGPSGGVWTPERLKDALRHTLRGKQIIVVANREPYIHQRGNDGVISVQHPASGLVTALEPIMRACSGVWIAHGSGSADRDTVDVNDCIRVPPGEESYWIRRVWLSRDEEQGYYYGFANEGLWPLCHMAYARPTFRSRDFQHYEAVNRKFAAAVCEEAASEDPVILVQDYHFALLPQFIRERLPKATIITFWHIPWPNAEQFGVCPWRDRILEGLLGSSIVGFHTQLHCNNFVEAVDRYLEARIDREQSAITRRGHRTLVRPYPISIEWPSQWAETSASHAECRRGVFSELGLPDDALLGVGVDRLDYTKGIEERLLAVERLLERFPSFRRRFTFVQLAAPSRTLIERYRKLDQDLEQLAGRINERFADGAYRPIIVKRAHHEPPTVFRYYRAAHVCYVSSLHDGMNLVAKEFVAARDDLKGVLVLSQFTGAARELTEALVVNPHDLEEASEALAAALTMRQEEQRERMRAMRKMVEEFNVYRWAGRMLVDAGRIQTKRDLPQRISDRIRVLPKVVP